MFIKSVPALSSANLRKMPQLSDQQRQNVLVLYDSGFSNRKVADIVGCSEGTIRKTLKRLKESGCVSDKPKSGRPRKTSERQDRLLVRNSLRNGFMTAPQLQQEVGLTDTVMTRTVRNRLMEQNLFARVAQRKPMVTGQNRRRHLQFARDHIEWTSEDWRQVVFIDESKLNRLGSDGRQLVRRRQGEAMISRCIATTLQGGGNSVMVWGMISSVGAGPLVRLQGRITAIQYTAMLYEYFLPFSTLNLPQNYIFMQDHVPIHKARSVSKFLKEENVDVLEWPAQSPDLNPIENL